MTGLGIILLLLLLLLPLLVLSTLSSPSQLFHSTAEMGASEPTPSNCDYWLGPCFRYALTSQHFVVFYNTAGPFAVTPEWAQNVSVGAEAAYAKFVVDFGLPAPERNPLPIYLDFSSGAYTNMLVCELCQPTRQDLRNLQIEYRFDSPCAPSCGLPTSYWQIAHEVFHTVQFTQFNGSIPFGVWLSEGSAAWAAYQVTGNESRWDPWAISGWLGPNGTTDRPLDYRKFDNAFFFVFLTEHYGGTELMKRIIAGADGHKAAHEVITSQLDSLGYRKTFAQLMDEFARAMITGNFTDRDGASAVLRTAPPLASETSWTGRNLTLSSFTKDANGFVSGQHLRVGVPFGIEYLKIDPVSNVSLSIELEPKNSSCFRGSIVAADREGRFSTSTIESFRAFTLSSPARYDRIVLAVIRGDCASGEFDVGLRIAGSGPVSTQAPRRSITLLELLVLLGALAALVLVVWRVTISKWRNPRRG